MTKPLPFENEAFDLIFHPVSNCYVEDVKAIWRECFRVLKPGGLLMAGLDNGINFLFDETDARRRKGVFSMRFRITLLKTRRCMTQRCKAAGASSFLIRWKSSCGGSFRQGLFLKIYMKTPMALVFCMTMVFLPFGPVWRLNRKVNKLSTCKF